MKNCMSVTFLPSSIIHVLILYHSEYTALLPSREAQVARKWVEFPNQSVGCFNLLPSPLSFFPKGLLESRIENYVYCSNTESLAFCGVFGKLIVSKYYTLPGCFIKCWAMTSTQWEMLEQMVPGWCPLAMA